MDNELKNDVLDDPRYRVKISQTSKGDIRWSEMTLRANTPEEIVKQYQTVKAELDKILNIEEYK